MVAVSLKKILIYGAFSTINRGKQNASLLSERYRVGRLAMTRMSFSDQGLNAQEAAFASALHDTGHFAISGDTLTLMHGNTVRARLVR